MNIIFFVFFSGVSSLGINNSKPSMGVLPDVISLNDDKQKEQEMANNPVTPQGGEKNTDNIPANEKTGNYYKDIKQFVFTTENSNGTVAEISVTAKTDLNFALRNYRISATAPKEKENEEFVRLRTTPNLPAFWSMLARAINGTTVSVDRDQLFQPIPASDINATSEEDDSFRENLKLKLMLGIALMMLLIFIPLMIFCITALHKLKQLNCKTDQSLYSIHPELATLSYFHPLEGVSDASFSKNPDSSVYWKTATSGARTPSIRMSNLMTDSEYISIPEQSKLLTNEEAMRGQQ